MDSLFDNILNDANTCTHFHTCHFPGRDLPHTHTCIHMHTKLLNPNPINNNVGSNNDDSAESKECNGRKTGCWEKEGGSHREAVRKYRQKKKAYTLSLANEVVSLRAMNQQLMQRLKYQVGLEAEVGRLTCLLVDIRGRIEGEIGSFPYQDKGGSGLNLPGSCMTVPCNGCEFQTPKCRSTGNMKRVLIDAS